MCASKLSTYITHYDPKSEDHLGSGFVVCIMDQVSDNRMNPSAVCKFYIWKFNFFFFLSLLFRLLISVKSDIEFMTSIVQTTYLEYRPTDFK